MDAINLINEHLTQDTIINVLENIGFSSVHPFGNDVRAECLVHGGHNSTSFIFRSDIKLWYCHACGSYGDMVQLIRILDESNVREACEKLAGILGLNIEGLDVVEHVSPIKKEIEKWFKFSKSIKRKSEKVEVYETPSIDLKKIAKFRGFSKETIEKFGLYYAKEFPIVSRKGDSLTIRERIMTPIWFNGNQVGVMLRRISKDEKIKWLIQPTSLDKDNVLYNLFLGTFYEEIVLVEGIWDVWAFVEAGIDSAVCLFGLSITEGQLKLLEQHTCNITFALDGDKPGREGVFKGIEKTKSKFNVSVLAFSDEEDPENIDRHLLRDRYETRLHYMDWLKKHEKEYELWKSKSKH